MNKSKIINPFEQNSGDSPEESPLILGPTGDFPEGQLNPQDEGGLQLAIVGDTDNNVLTIHFGTPVAWFAMSPDDAIELGNKIIENANKVKEAQIKKEE